MKTPQSSGYYFPAEWEKHEATWLTYPYHEESFPGKMELITEPYHKFIRVIAASEKVRINVQSEAERVRLAALFATEEMPSEQIELFVHPSNDVWCRDHGPSFVVNPALSDKKAIVNWHFNAWGNKYPSDLDNRIPERVAAHFGLPLFEPGIIMEGGAIEVNGKGTLLTTTACLLNHNRNPHLSQQEIATALRNYYNVEQIIWLADGIEGDDTDGHIDDIARFVAPDRIITVVETGKSDSNRLPLQQNL
ncbi:MAG: agmatine/peptidylarginine deiminase, partial [Bacteroidales bacterium]